MSWRPAAGVVDNYLVQLQDRTQTVHTLVVSHSSPPECSFSSLVAGRLYSVVIVTRSDSLENATTVQARTRRDILRDILDPFMFKSVLKTVFKCSYFCFSQNQPPFRIQQLFTLEETTSSRYNDANKNNKIHIYLFI